MRIRQSLEYTLALAAMLALVALSVLPAGPARAQSGNLLQNATFDGAYTGRGGISGGVPESWHVWGNFQNSDHENLGVLRVSAPYAWRLRTYDGQPTGGGFQTVSVQSGTRYRFSVYAMIWTCDDAEWQCRDSSSTWSDPESGGYVRVGIDPTGGTNPYASTVVWGSAASPMTWGSFAGLSVEATAATNALTVFTFYGAERGMRFNDVFWDNASLVAVGSGSSGDSGSQQPAATAVPVSNSPTLRADGSSVHVVQAGQTLWAISQVYGVPLETLIAMNNLSSTTIYVGQQIVVKAAPATAVPAPTSAPAATATPFPTQIAQQATQSPVLTPVPVGVTPSSGSASTDANGISGTARTLVLVIAAGVVLTAVGVTGALVGYIGWRVLRT